MTVLISVILHFGLTCTRTVDCSLMSPFHCCEAGVTWRWNSFIFIFQKARSSPSDNTRTDTTQEQELAQSFDYVATLCREDSNEVIVSYLWLSVLLNLGCVLPWWLRPSPKTCLPSRFSPRDLTITSTKKNPYLIIIKTQYDYNMLAYTGSHGTWQWQWQLHSRAKLSLHWSRCCYKIL